MIHASPQVKSSVTPGELYRRLCDGVPCEIIDVRTAPEHAAGHVAGARLVPLDSLEPQSFLRRRAQADAPLFVICQSGARAAKAMEDFRRAGFEGCILVQGGTQAWIDAGLPVERRPTRIWPLIRQVQVVVGFFGAVGSVLALFAHPWFAVVPLIMGFGILFAGLTGTCGLASLLAKMPWNRQSPATETSCCNC